jgi:hypothetical protein
MMQLIRRASMIVFAVGLAGCDQAEVPVWCGWSMPRASAIAQC